MQPRCREYYERKGSNIMGASSSVSNKLSQEVRKAIIRHCGRRTKVTQGAFEACWQNGTAVSHTLIRPGQSTIAFRQGSRRGIRETGKVKGRGRGRTAVSVYTKKLWNLRNCSRRSIKGHNSKEASSSLTLLAYARVTKKKSTESNPGGRIDAKDQRPETSYTPTPLKISRRRSNRSSRCFHTKRPS